ncbi:MAG: Mini-ribonuclease 3 [Clostridia bacterium]|nr:Mini-ribonuclease 3 [Clostridia bacterium]
MFKNTQPITEAQARNLNPVVLAYVGDAVYSLYVRENLVITTDFKTGQLQKLSSGIVSAHGQSELLDRIMPLFTEDENDVFRRGRNAKKGTKSKNASVGEYNRSTGFEAVLGYLYLTGNSERIEFLLKDSDEN